MTQERMKDMPLYRFNFSVDAWLTHLEIEADSLAEAKQELKTMPLEIIVEESRIKDYNLKDIDVEEVEEEYDYE